MAPSPKVDKQQAGVSDRERRARAEVARRAVGGEVASGPQLLAPGQTEFYHLLGVEAGCSAQDILAAYRKRALEEHPDKGGDQESFDELHRAYKVLSDENSRQAYDEERVRESRKAVVEGRPQPKPPSEKPPTEKAAKTAPRVGSKRSKDWLRCSAEHDADRSGAALVAEIKLAILDQGSAAAAAPLGAVAPAMTLKDEKELEKEQTEALFEKYRGLNQGMKKQWVSTLTGKQRQALKVRCKEEEAQQLTKAKKWLAK